MMVLAFILTMLTPAQDAADRANEAYVGCLFAAAREANTAGMDADRFEAQLARRCQDEEKAARSAFIRVGKERGQPGVVEVDRLLRHARESVAKTYRDNR